MSSSPTKAIQREDASALPEGESARRRSVLDAAKARALAKGGRPQDMTGTPRFDRVEEDAKAMRPAPGHNMAPPTLSPQTSAALEAIAAANQRSPAEEPVVEDEALPDLDMQAIGELLRVDMRTAKRIHDILHPEKDSDTSRRRAVEKRIVNKLDIGEFLMNGTVTQRVPVIPVTETMRTGLEVTYQTVHDVVESYVDRALADEAAKIRKVREGETFVDSEMSQREYVRRQNEYALATHVKSYGNTSWPAVVKPDGNVDENAMQKRIGLVKQIPSPLFTLLVNNLGWFLERVQEALDVAVLGNG